MDRALADVNIAHLCDRPVETLSGGERQRAWIAMLLAQEPEVMLLDEPTTFLDIGCQYEILRLVRRLNREKGITTVMVLHDLNQAARYAGRIARPRRLCGRSAGLHPDLGPARFGVRRPGTRAAGRGGGRTVLHPPGNGMRERLLGSLICLCRLFSFAVLGRPGPF